MANDVRLRLSGLTKQFGSSVVLNHVSLDVRKGQIHGLIGQNGAGKSTLVKTLAGLYPDHAGEVTVDGKKVGLRTPRQSRSEGIAVVYQEFSLVSSMTVAENLLLGREPNLCRYSARAIRERAAETLRVVGIDIGASTDARVDEQSPAVRQRIEIAKALAQNARVLVMDEPTARLSEGERLWLFDTMRSLSDRGVGIMFISHFLEEVLGITDWLTVMRNGLAVASGPTEQLTVGRMAELMLGEELTLSLERESHVSRASDDRPITLEACNVSAGPRLRDVSVALRSGEILGVAGLVGAGRTRLARVLAGVDRPTEGTILVRGEHAALRSPRNAIAKGIALIPEDRKNQGLSLVSSLADNLCLMSLQRRLGRWGFVKRRAVKQLGSRLVRDLEVSPPKVEALAGTLSGGNQQKIVIGKVLAAEPDILIIDQPTAGVDIGTKAQIHRILRAHADSGATIMVVSDDIDEIYTLSDRICVMRKGRVLWQGAPTEVERSHLLQLISAGRIEHVAGEQGGDDHL